MKLRLWDNNGRGFVALITVLIIGLIGTTITVAILLFSIGSILTSNMLEDSSQAKALADMCADEALERLRRDPAYAGSEIINVGDDSCEILAVQDLGGGVMIVQVTGNVGTVVRKVEVRTTQVTPDIQIDYWDDVADFL